MVVDLNNSSIVQRLLVPLWPTTHFNTYTVHKMLEKLNNYQDSMRLAQLVKYLPSQHRTDLPITIVLN
jgi:hypothetical protein